jgi:hypothetical protein
MSGVILGSAVEYPRLVLSALCIIGATFMACFKVKYWGWMVFAALIIGCI